jgi:hypothetical protein
MDAGRRGIVALAGTALLGGCTGMPLADSGAESRARDRLRALRRAHGGDEAWKGVRDIAVAYDGEWYSIVKRLQPELVDDRYRKTSQERIVPGVPLTAQEHEGPGGRKFVLRRGSEIVVRYDGKPAADADRIAASALVADAYRMFLTAPFMVGSDALVPALGEPQWIDARRCDVVVVNLRPGLGWDGSDRVALFVEQETSILRRLRFTIDALPSTKGAVVEVDLDGHRRIGELLWPTQFFERIRTPVPMLPAHRWWMTGLDLNRGLSAGDFREARFSAKASVPAKALAG